MRRVLTIARASPRLRCSHFSLQKEHSWQRRKPRESPRRAQEDRRERELKSTARYVATRHAPLQDAHPEAHQGPRGQGGRSAAARQEETPSSDSRSRWRRWKTSATHDDHSHLADAQGTRGRGVRVRRSPHLVAYWRGARSSPATTPPAHRSKSRRKRATCSAAATTGRSSTTSSARASSPSSTFAATIDRMVELTLLERSDRPRDPRVSAMDTLQPLEPAGRVLPRDHQGRALRVARVARRRALVSGRRRRLPAGHQALRRPRDASTFRAPDR